jgi:hypothetical protein
MQTDVSDGEVIDRTATLKVKMDWIADPDKLRNIAKDYELLRKCLIGGAADTTVAHGLFSLHPNSQRCTLIH